MPVASTDAPQPLGATDDTPQELGTVTEEKPEELGATPPPAPADTATPDAPPEQMGTPLTEPTGVAASRTPKHFHAWFWSLAALGAAGLAVYYWRMDGEQLEILKELVASVVPRCSHCTAGRG